MSEHQQIILAGSPANGYQAFGPFADFLDAHRYGQVASKYPGTLHGTAYSIMPLRRADVIDGIAYTQLPPDAS